jgi:hypothetical protein
MTGAIEKHFVLRANTITALYQVILIKIIILYFHLFLVSISISRIVILLVADTVSAADPQS